MCSAARPLFKERNKHVEMGGWDTNVKLLTKPLVLSMEINVSVSCPSFPNPQEFVLDIDLTEGLR